MPPQPEVFIFDCFGVLFDFDVQILYSRLEPYCSSPKGGFSLETVLAVPELVTGHRTLAEHHAFMRETYGLTLDYEDFVQAWTQPYSWPMPGMAELLNTLAASYPLLLLSNIDAYYWRAIRPLHDELNLFKALLLSCNLGLAKPDPEIFVHAVAVTGTASERCFFIDDTLRNVEVARDAGLQTHWFRGAAGLREELLRLNVRGL